jgi:plastocyanin
MRYIVGIAIASTVPVLAACGGGGSSVSYTTAVTPAPAASTTPEPSPSPSPTATPTPKETAAPAPANATAVEGGKVTVEGTEFKFAPDALTADAGKIEVTLSNAGSAPHEIVFIKTKLDPGALEPGTDGRVSEKGAVGEVPEIEGGATKSATISFKPGNYVFVCNVPGHYQGGMHGTLVVR